MGGDGARRADYRMARIGSGAAFTLVLVFLLVGDFFSEAYHVEVAVLLPLLGIIMALFGVEARELIRTSTHGSLTERDRE